MFNKIKTLSKNPAWHNLRDVRVLGFVVFGVMVILATWSGVAVIETNYELQKQIAQLDQQNKLQELTNSNLSLRNEYYKSDTFLELTARKQLGKGAPGETLLLVPKSIALVYAKEIPETTVKPQTSLPDDRPSYQKNFSEWMDFIFHRQG
jgi:cell division protein FtsB